MSKADFAGMLQRDLRVHRGYLVRNSFIHKLNFLYLLQGEYNGVVHSSRVLDVILTALLLFFSVNIGSESGSDRYHRYVILALIVFLTLI